MAHLVMSVKASAPGSSALFLMTFYWDTVRRSSSPNVGTALDFSTWDTTDFLQIAPSGSLSDPDAAWEGEIYSIAFYDVALTQEEITAKYNEGATVSRPASWSYSTRVGEDVPTPIILNCTDPENDPCSFEILTPPARGTLYFNGTNTPLTTPNSRTPNQGLQQVTLTFIPAAGFIGSDSFTFLARDSVGLPSIEHTIWITIFPTNDLPVATSFSQGVYEKVNTELILSGTDIDEGDSATSAIVYSLPTRGHLQQFDGTPITTVPTNVTDHARRIRYYYNTSSDNATQAARIIVAYDSFLFRVRDTTGALSSNESLGKATLSILNSMVIHSILSIEVVENTETLISLTGVDNANEPYYAELHALPTRGSLYRLSDVFHPLTAGDLPFVVPTGNLSLYYTPEADYFGYDSIQYAIVNNASGAGGGGVVPRRSPIGTREIIIAPEGGYQGSLALRVPDTGVHVPLDTNTSVPVEVWVPDGGDAITDLAYQIRVSFDGAEGHCFSINATAEQATTLFPNVVFHNGSFTGCVTTLLATGPFHELNAAFERLVLDSNQYEGQVSVTGWRHDDTTLAVANFSVMSDTRAPTAFPTMMPTLSPTLMPTMSPTPAPETKIAGYSEGGFITLAVIGGVACVAVVLMCVAMKSEESVQAIKSGTAVWRA
jgi:hypothetical protein